jgi:hypothetical protein
MRGLREGLAMSDSNGETVLWIDAAHPRLLHHYQDCWPVLGDVCAMCRRRYLYENSKGVRT